MSQLPVRIFVGVDRSQLLAVKVLEYSVKKRTDLPVEVYPMLDLDIPKTKDPRQGSRTGFSFSRFCIPQLAEYNGRAIYMDADMLVLNDIRELWELPFNGAKIIVQEDLSKNQANTSEKIGAPRMRKKQCAVMVLNCSDLDWNINQIISELDNEQYSYGELMHDLCILNESEIGYRIPFRWNSLEYLDESTCLIHYTDMHTQPWTSPYNAYQDVWMSEMRDMLKTGALTWDEVNNEIELGFFRPSLALELKLGHRVPHLASEIKAKFFHLYDKSKGYMMHKEVYEAKRIRMEAIKKYENDQVQSSQL